MRCEAALGGSTSTRGRRCPVAKEKKTHEEPCTARGSALSSRPSVTSHPASSFYAARSNNVPGVLVGGVGVKGSQFSCAA
jgi:hypothetical protein